MDSLFSNGQNFYVYLHPKTNKFLFLPWDQDFSFGRFGRGGATSDLSIHYPWRNQSNFLTRVFNTPAFKQLYLKRLREFNTEFFQPERFANIVDEIAAAIKQAVAEESAYRATSLERITTGEYSSIKAFAAQRARSLASQLAAVDK